MIQESLKKIGIEVTATQMEWGAFVAETPSRTESCGKEGSDIYASANTFRPDPDGYLYTYFHSKGDHNKGGCDRPNPKVDALLVEARQSSNQASAAGSTTRPRRSARREPELVVVRQVQHRGGVEQGARILAVVHGAATLPEEDLAGLTR